jgi:small-conductance mechanosensitive channel
VPNARTVRADASPDMPRSMVGSSIGTAMNETTKLLDRAFFTIGGTAVTPASLVSLGIVAVATLLASWILQRALKRVLAVAGITREGPVAIVQRLAHYSILAVGLSVGLDVLGINISTLFAAGAIFAIGLGFAMQNIAQNFMAGVILLIEHSIKPGDVLEVDGRFVRVREMGIRATIARTLDDEEIIIPNAGMVQATVKNYTLRDSIYRLRATVGVTYSSDMKLVRETLERVSRALPTRNPTREPVVLMSDFADSAVVFDVSVWIDDPWAVRRAKSELLEAIWWAFKEANITIAFPQMDVHLDDAVVTAMAAHGRRSGRSTGAPASEP